MPEHSTAQRTRRRWIVAGSVAGTAALALCWLLLYAAPEARNAIQVEPRWLRCGGESMPYEITNADDDSSDPSPEFVIRLKDKNYDRCQMQFTIINTGDRRVHIDKVEFPGMAPGESGWLLEADENLGAFKPQDMGADYSNSAFIDVNSDLDGSSSFDHLIDLRFRPSTVSDLGTDVIASMSNLPRVHLSYLGVPRKTDGRITIAIVN